MINIDWIYDVCKWEGEGADTDEHWNTFECYIQYWSRRLATVYNINGDDMVWRILYIEKNWRLKKYKVYWYYNRQTLYWFILWILYGNDSNQSD